jgi:hypothetical protein
MFAGEPIRTFQFDYEHIFDKDMGKIFTGTDPAPRVFETSKTAPSTPSVSELVLSVFSRGRDVRCRTPPAQIRTGAL